MNPLNRLIAESAILKTCSQLHHSEDELDRATMLSCFIPSQNLTLDMSIHRDMPPSEITPEGFWEKLYNVLGGFNATQHLAGNSVITFDEADERKAHVKQSVLVYHCIEEGGILESVTSRAVIEFGMRVWEDRWLITKVVIKRDCPLDNAELYQRAMERAKTDLLRKPKSSV